MIWSLTMKTNRCHRKVNWWEYKTSINGNAGGREDQNYIDQTIWVLDPRFPIRISEVSCFCFSVKYSLSKLENQDPTLFGFVLPDRCAHYAIYDGHGGRLAAEYAQKHLHKDVLSAGLPRELVCLLGLILCMFKHLVGHGCHLTLN